MLILAFGAILMLAVLMSERANRTVLSASVLFLGAGVLIGQGGFGWIDLGSRDGLLQRFASLALFVILFADGAQLPLSELKQAWRLPGRALLLGMPLTLAGVAIAGHLLLDMNWFEALLVGAILSPTDPVFVAAILEREAVPRRLRGLLQVESGLNDGLALPLVMVLIALTGHRDLHIARALLESAVGIALGVGIPLAFLQLERHSFFAATEAYRPLGGTAIACVLFGLSEVTHGNEFLAAFAGGVTIASRRPQHASSYHELGRPIAEVLKLATLLVFGALLRVDQLFGLGLKGLAFALLALLAARPLALVLALLGGGLSKREWLAAAWFGPKGFASLLYAVLMLHSSLPRGVWLFQIISLVIVISVVAHSSTDVLIARSFHGTEPLDELPS